MIFIHDSAPFGRGNKWIVESIRFQIIHVILLNQLENIWNIRNSNAYIVLRQFKNIIESLQQIQQIYYQ